ncbi:hypothetical protein ACIPQA_25885 [Streptomyces sp. NPDC090109]|uniref:hypothetical protein n=1 Tax=unclassified Streptomyces TaxID=2593676 RepID=UPI0035A09F19
MPRAASPRRADVLGAEGPWRDRSRDGSALAARHRIGLNRVGRPVRIAPGRRLTETAGNEDGERRDPSAGRTDTA